MDKRSRYVEEALRLFVWKGFRAVTIGELTQRLGISSKTIYQVFGDKQSLAQEALALYQARNEAIMDQLWEDTSDPADLLLRFYRERIDALSRMSPLFFREARSWLLPEQEQAIFFGQRHSHQLLVRGQMLSMFHAQVNPEVASATLTLLLEHICERQRFAGHSTQELMQQVIWPYLRGLCTPEGLAVFRNHRHRYFPADSHE
jgi:AcrR family transcriptional regulator